MKKESITIICLVLCLGFVVSCLPDGTGNLNDNLPLLSPTIPALESETEIEPEATASITPLPAPTATPTTISVPAETPIPTQPPTGEVHIFSEPDGALAFIASEDLSGQTPATLTILPGTYTVTLTLDSYKDWTMPITVTAGSELTLTATLRQQHTILPIAEGIMASSEVQWSEDGQTVIYALSDRQWPAHVQWSPYYKSWWLYNVTDNTTQPLPPPQTRVTDVVRELLGICSFILPETLPYSCSFNLEESPAHNRIVYSSTQLNDAWLANIDGTDVVELSTFPDSPNDVIWSNNDQWLLIGRYAAIDHSNVYYLVSSDGAFVESLEGLTETNHWRVQGVKPQFSPDGQRVAFVGIETGGRQLTAEQQDNEEAYNLYVLDLNTLERELISTRFGLFQWSDDGNGLYILDGAANTAGNNIPHQLAGLQYADFYYIDLTQAGYPEQKLAGDIPIYLPNVGAWAYSPEARAMAGTFGIEGQGLVFSLLFLP